MVLVADPALRPAFYGLFVLVVGALWWGHTRLEVTIREVLVGAILLRLIAFGMPPTLSDDYHRYLWDGYVQTQGVNPYAHTPADSALYALRAEIPTVYEALNSKAYYSVYPPVSQLIFRVSWVGATAQQAYWLYKLLALLVEGIGVLLLARLLAPRLLMVYAWFPFLLIELIGQAHTEVFAVTLVIAALVASKHQKFGLAGLCVGLAAWVKIYPILFLPFLVVSSRDWRSLVGFVISGVVWLPYLDGFVWEHVWSSLRLYYQLFEFNAGWYLGVKHLLWWLDGTDYSKSLGPLFSIGFAFSGLAFFCYAWWRRVRFEHGIYGVLLLYLLFATTVHPWYLTLILPFVVRRGEAAPWYFLCTVSTGTYLFYSHGIYWPFVWIGWGVFFLMMALHYRPNMLGWMLQTRAKRKVARIKPHLPPTTETILDIGAAEGLVGAHLAEPAQVTLIDVIDMNRSRLPLTLYDGTRLPYEDQSFDVVLLIYVLHHAAQPASVLQEALRVAKQRVIIVESTTDNKPRYYFTYSLDIWANRLRSKGAMRDQEEQLAFHAAPYWAKLIRKMGATCVWEDARGVIDRHTVYVAAPAHRSGKTIVPEHSIE